MSQGTIEQSQGQQGSDKKDPGANRSLLVQRLLDASASLPAFINDLLTTQAVTVAGTEAAAFLIERGQSENGPTMGLRAIAHIRPDNSSAETRAAAINAFQDIVKPCIQQGKDGAIEIGAPNDAHETQFCLVTLLRTEGEIVAVSAVITRCVNPERARQRLMSMQLVAGYFELFTLKKTSEQSRMIAQSHQHVLQLATAVATAEGFESAAMNLCNELATRSHATRVSLGWLKGRNIRVKALSHTEQFDKKQELVVQLEKVMEECADQDAVVQFDPNGQSSDNVTRDAASLSRAQGGHIVLSLPLRRGHDVIGVITLEFLPNQQLGPHVANGLAVAVDLLAPQLYDRYQNDRWLITKTGISIREGTKVVIGPKHMLAKLVAVLVLAAALFVTFYKPMYKVGAPFQFVSDTRRAVSAPFEGYLGQLERIDGDLIKPGTEVKKGQVLIRMDTHDIVVQQAEAMKQAEAKRREAERYRAEKPARTAEANQAEAERDASLERVKLYQLQIDRANIVAPIDGVVLAGNLEDRQGAAVKQGDVLFEIGPLKSLKAELSVSERDVQDLKVGQTGRIATTSLPSDKYPITIERIVPLGETKDGNNVFKVYARLDQTAEGWRPGQVGEARVDVRHERLAWIWTHRLVDFLKLKLWI